MVDQWLRGFQENLYQCPFQIPSLDSLARARYPPFKLQVAKGQGHNFFDGQFLMLHILSHLDFCWVSAGFAPWNWEVLFSMSLGTQFIHGL